MQRVPPLFQSFLPVVILILLIMVNVLWIGGDTLGGANQLALLVASAIAIAIAIKNGYKWEVMMDKIVQSVSTTMPAIIILFMIGMLAGSWMLSGVIPSMIYYGLDILKPDYFLPATVIICAIVSVSIGSSWSTVATIGVALLGIGQTLGFSTGMVAGAIISGAYFGDKVSPLSDTTNLSAAVSETNLFTHIKYLMKTTVPSIVITLIIFTILTFTTSQGNEASSVGQMQDVLAQTFNITPFLFIIPLLVIVLIAKKVPPIPVLFMGTVAAVIAIVVAQQGVLEQLSQGNLTLKTGYDIISRALYTENNIETGHEAVNKLLTTYGMSGMLNTVWFIMTAMIFGGIMEAGGFLSRITQSAIQHIKSRGSLITTTTLSGLFLNTTASDQYLSIVIAGKMFAPSYKRQGLAPQVLGRTLEDSITVTSVLVPWNTCGATQATILNVATMTYAPYAFFCILSPLITVLYGWLGKVATTKKEATINAEESQQQVA
ncbi:MAG: Na+/H+ antiporter NhaC [Marinifilaceae bacterium]